MLEQLYKAAILEHYKRPRNRGTLPAPATSEVGINPSCGDELELFLSVENKIVKEVAFIGEGCAISQASASMMTQAIKGKTLAEVNTLSADFKTMLHGEDVADALGELKVLQGVSKLHARVKCAVLPWTVLEGLIEKIRGLGKIE